MRRIAAIAGFCLYLCVFGAQAATPAASDPQSVSLAQQSVAALSGGIPISDVRISANVTSIAGSDNETGTGTFRAKGTSESCVDLTVSGGNSLRGTQCI